MKQLSAVTSLAVVVLVAWSAGAAAQSDGSEPADATGDCTAIAVVDGGVTIDPYESGGVYEVPLSGSATYTGAVSPVPETPRPIEGRVEIVTPPGIPNIEVSDSWVWNNDAATDVEASGSVSWDLPSILPRGVPITVEGFHSESGTVVCEGSVRIELEGGPFDSPLTPVALVGTVLAAAGVAFAAAAKGAAA